MSSQNMLSGTKFQVKQPKPRPKREDVIGTGEKFLEDILASIESAPIFDSMGVSPNTSYLLAGHHGTGKSFCIEALNNTLNTVASKIDFWKLYDKMLTKNEEKPEKDRLDNKTVSRICNDLYLDQIEAHMFEYRISDYGTAYINMGSRILQKFFNLGKNYAKNGRTVILVFDEADQIMGMRGKGGHGEDDKLISTLMKNLQDVQDNPNLFTVFLTNFPKAMDSASIRAGRIDKRYNFELPTQEEREQLVKSIIRQRNDAAGYMVVRKYDTKEVATKCEGFSNADIDQVIKEALRKRAREISRERSDNIIPAGYVTQVRLLDAIEKHRKKFKLKRNSIGY